MVEIVEFPVEGGGVVYVEVVSSAGADGEDALGRAGFGKWVQRKAQVSFQEALSTARATAEAVAQQFRGITPQPEEVEVTFGMKVTGGINTNFIVAGGESNLNVRILWGKQVTDPAPNPPSHDV
jgi:Trypsin-co-occurring domain 1